MQEKIKMGPEGIEPPTSAHSVLKTLEADIIPFNYGPLNIKKEIYF